MDTLILTSLLVLMGISTFTSKEFIFLQGIWLIGNEILISHLTRIKSGCSWGFPGDQALPILGQFPIGNGMLVSQGFWCVLRRDLPGFPKPKVSMSLPWLKPRVFMIYGRLSQKIRNLPSILSAISIATHRDSPSSAPRVLPFEEPLRDDPVFLCEYIPSGNLT